MKLNYLLSITDFTGLKYDQISGNYNIVDLIKTLSERYGDSFRNNMLNSDMTKPSDDTTILINGVNIEFLGGSNAIVNDSDTVTFLPEIMGG